MQKSRLVAAILHWFCTNGDNPAVVWGFSKRQVLMRKIINNIKTYLKSEKIFQTEFIICLISIPMNLDASIEKWFILLFEQVLFWCLLWCIFSCKIFRSTLIPAIAVPVPVVGAFFFLNLLGYSLNLLTLFALVLAIGIVVDDAIVVVEAVHAKMEHGLTMPKAINRKQCEITGAIISIFGNGSSFYSCNFIQAD